MDNTYVVTVQAIYVVKAEDSYEAQQEALTEASKHFKEDMQISGWIKIE